MGVKATGEGLRAYYKSKIEDLEVQIRDRTQNLQRMEAQRNELNMKGKERSRQHRTRLRSVEKTSENKANN
jgi:biotin carboxylase